MHFEVVLQDTQENQDTGSQFWMRQTNSPELLEMGTTPDLVINKISLKIQLQTQYKNNFFWSVLALV